MCRFAYPTCFALDDPPKPSLFDCTATPDDLHQTSPQRKVAFEAKRSFYLNIVERIGHIFQTPSRFDFASGVQQFGPAHLAGCDDPARLLLACEGDGSSSNMSREAWTMILSCVPPAMMGGACDASKYGTTLSWVQTSHGRGKIVKDCQRSPKIPKFRAAQF